VAAGLAIHHERRVIPGQRRGAPRERTEVPRKGHEDEDGGSGDRSPKGVLMGYEDRANRNGREGARLLAEAEAARVQALPFEPKGEPAGLAPSPFLTEIAAQRLAACNNSAAMIRAHLSRPNLTIAGRPEVDRMATLLMNVALLLDAQAATMDLLLSFLTGKAGLRPIAPPTNGDSVAPDGLKS
jgi:hypothetical protein